jgi:hypothetical protein
MRCRLHETRRHRRSVTDPLSRLPAAQVTPDPVFRAALRERLASGSYPTASDTPVRAPERPRPRARRPRVIGGLMVALVLLCAHLATCLQP